MDKIKSFEDLYDKITNETLNKAYKKFLKLNENKQPLSDINYYQSDNATSLREISREIYSNNDYDRSFIDKRMFINGYEIKPELMNKIKSFEDFNVFLESCKNNVIEDTNRQKTASVLSRTIETNYDEKEIKLLVEYLQDILKKESN